MTLWQSTRAFLVRRRRLLLVALVLYLALMALLVWSGRSSQTEPFRYLVF